MPLGRFHRLMSVFLSYCLRPPIELPPCCCRAKTQPTTCSRKKMNLPLGPVRKCGSPDGMCRCLTVQAEQPRSCATSRIVIGSPKLLAFMTHLPLTQSLAHLCARQVAVKSTRNNEFSLLQKTDYLHSRKLPHGLAPAASFACSLVPRSPARHAANSVPYRTRQAHPQIEKKSQGNANAHQRLQVIGIS